jgi:hypothetical protein
MIDHVEVLRTWILLPATEGVHTKTRAELPPISAAPQPEPAMGTSDGTEKLPALLMLTMAIKLAPDCSVPQYSSDASASMAHAVDLKDRTAVGSVMTSGSTTDTPDTCR